MQAIIFILTCAVAFAIWQNWRLRKQYVEFRDNAVLTLGKATEFSEVATETDKAISNRLDGLNELHNDFWKHLTGLTNYLKIISYRDGPLIIYEKIKPTSKPKTKKGKK